MPLSASVPACDALFAIDGAGKVVAWNDGASELFGWPRDEILGQALDATVLPRTTGPPFPAEVGGIPLASPPEPLAARRMRAIARHRDGTAIPVEFSLTPVEMAMQTLYTGFVRPLAEALKDTQALAERERLAAIVESSTDAILSIDLSGRILSWNHGEEVLYGYPEEEAVGHPVAMLLVEGARSDPLFKGPPMGEASARPLETRRRHRDGRTIDVSTTVSPIREASGSVVGLSAIERDVTDRRRRERELQQAKDQAEATSRAKSDFVANISHELRTPMNAIIGMVELALRSGTINRDLRDYLDTAQESAHLLLDLVDDLLDFSRMEAGHFELDVEPFELRRTLEQTVRLLSLRAHSRGLELVCHIAPDVPDRVEGDHRRLRQIVMNLVANAIKFTPQGEVVVDVRVQSRTDSQVELLLSVKDTGIGISPEDQERIFRPFTQADASLTREQPGAGLGLTICKELVQKMGGRIWLESTPGKGTTFWCTPRLKVSQRAPSVSILSSPDWQGLRALVADDNQSTVRTMEEILTHWGFRVETAANAGEAARVVAQAEEDRDPVRVLFVDALLPEIDGLTFVQTLRRQNLIPPTTLVMGSIADRELIGERLEDMDVAGAIEKPVSQSALFDTLATVLEGPMDFESLDISTDSPVRRLDVLVAEDTRPNQKVVKAILEHRGHRVQIASNGRQAVEMAAAGHFDILLMDVQMPTMDGLQATAEIRRSKNAELARVPIVALTAHAMRRDRERCLAAGMNGYLSKPIDAQTLIRMIEDLAARSGGGLPFATPVAGNHGQKPTADADGTAAMPESDPPQLINLSRALERMGGDRSLLADMARFYVEDVPKLLESLRAALDSDQREEAARAAHSLKGLSSNFDAHDAVHAALTVEMACRSADLPAARVALPALQARTTCVIDALRRDVLDAACLPLSSRGCSGDDGFSKPSAP